MIWFGRCDAGQRWAASTTRLAREVLDDLVALALPFPAQADDAELVVRHGIAARPAAQGRWATVIASDVPRGELPGPITWAGEPPPADALAAGDPAGPLPFVRVEVRSRSGRPVAGALLVPDGAYTLREVRRAVEASLEGGEPRPGRWAVLASARRPSPGLRPCSGSDLAANFAVCRCENPICPSRGAEVLVRWSSADPWGSGADAVACACPSCPGPWGSRWALTWVRPAMHREVLGGLVVDYPVEPTQRRRTPVPGPMQVVAPLPQAATWGGWTATTIGRIPAGLRRFLRVRRPGALRAALLDEPAVTGSLLQGLVSTENLRALVEHLRRLPAPRRMGGVATGLAHAFCPRRPVRYQTDTDAVQAAHFHYIAFEPEAFVERLHAYGALDAPGRFLDVGCGVGEKVFLAYALGRFDRCDGLEYDPRTAAVAEFLFDRLAGHEPYPVQIIRGDALAFDRYGEYDVIYMYRPFRQRQPMAQLVRRIAAQMRPGALMCDVLKAGFALRKAPDGTLLTVGTMPHPGRTATWDQPVTLDAFLVQMGLADDAAAAAGHGA